jgi:PAS domain S-box-containing protein
VDERLLREGLHDLYEDAPCGYLFTSPDGSLVHVNRTFLHWTGYTDDELLSQRLQDILTVAGRLFYENQYAPLMLMQGSVQEVAFDFVCKDGSRLPTLVTSTLRRDEAGSPLLVASAIFSAAERRAYERELLAERARAEHLAQVVTASSDAIITCTAEGRVLTWNRSAELLFGYTSERLSDLTLHDLLPFENDETYDGVMGSLRAGTAVHAETLGVAANGERVDIAVSIAPHADELGALGSLSAIMRDIRERRALERLQGEFLAMASHELRTPLVSILGFAQLMQRRQIYNEQAVATIVAQTRTLTHLIDDLLAASQLEAGGLTLTPSDVDLVAVVREAVGLMSAQGRVISVEAPAGALIVHADSQRLHQVLANLLTNAMKYSTEGSDIAVRVRSEGGDARVDVTDHGIGINPEDLAHVFDRFFRSAEAVEHEKGAGLGLFITRRLVERQGGTIRVESVPGEGSTFSFTLPLRG